MRPFHSFIVLPLVAVLCACGTAQDAKQDDATTVAVGDSQISEYVRRVFQDHEGNFWFGTNDDGVCRYDGKSLDYFSIEQGLAGKAVRGIVQDSDGAMWFATEGGVSHYKDGRFTNYSVADGLSDNDVWSMMLDRSGTLWVGTLRGVCRFDGRSFVAFALPRAEVESPEFRFSPVLVWSMFEDRAGNIWFGTDGEGARKFDGKSFTIYTRRDGLVGNQVACILGDRLGRIWFGAGSGGVSCYDGTAFQTFTIEDGLIDGWVWTMQEDKSGFLWISTLGSGVSRYDGTSFTAFREPNGLTRTHVQSILEDKSGTLWFGCSGGLFRFDGSRFTNVTRKGPWQAPEPSDAAAANPMASFARMLGGEWKMTAQSGTSMYDRWQWGPGMHSMRVTTVGEAADGSPWRALRVEYWHPGHKEVRLLSMHPDIPGVGRGVGDGTTSFVGDTLETSHDLYQTRGPRKLLWRSIFAGPDDFRTTLLESNGSSGYQTLAAWDYSRVNESAATTAAIPEDALGLPEELPAFESFIGHTWDTEGKGGAGEGIHVQSTFEYVPLAEYVYGRIANVTDSGMQAHMLDVYFYHHVGTNALRCLALSSSGGVYEGDVTVSGAGALQIALQCYESDSTISRIVRLDLQNDGTLRQRVWSLDGSESILVIDLLHNKIRS